ncbi:MAG: hypothetical protein FJX29_15515 [Alphaproteobacteria bacterium]|nr:hypothetical protein [Alphaproteobacteria bacterium]
MIAVRKFSLCLLPVTGVLGIAGFIATQAVAQTRQPSNECANYGSGFVAVQGTGSCVRIGGRMRVEGSISGSSGGSNNAAGGSGGAPATGASQFAPGFAPMRAHMRLEGPFGARR